MKILKDKIEKRAVIHGEIIIVPIDKVPAKAIKTFSGIEFVAGHSETGHHHVIEGVVTAYKLPIGGDSEQVFFTAVADTKLKHLKTFDRHEDMPIVAGTYQIIQKNEFDLFTDVLRKVRD